MKGAEMKEMKGATMLNKEITVLDTDREELRDILIAVSVLSKKLANDIEKEDHDEKHE